MILSDSCSVNYSTKYCTKYAFLLFFVCFFHESIEHFSSVLEVFYGLFKVVCRMDKLKR